RGLSGTVEHTQDHGISRITVDKPHDHLVADLRKEKTPSLIARIGESDARPYPLSGVVHYGYLHQHPEFVRRIALQLRHDAYLQAVDRRKHAACGPRIDLILL